MPDDIEYMLPSLFRRDIRLDFVTEKDGANLVIVVNSREGQHGAELSDQIFFACVHRTEKRAGAHIHQQHYGQLAFFFEKFAEGMVESGGHIPINKADIISGRIFSYLPKAHPPAFEGAVIFSGEKVTGEPFAFNIELSYLLQYFGCSEHGPFNFIKVSE